MSNSPVEIIFWGILTFSILVVVHELGHFLAARAFGLKVHEFMVGLPGPAIRLTTKRTAYGVTAVPLGGYVRIAGMEPGAEDELLGPALADLTAQRELDASGLTRDLGLDLARAESLLHTLADWGAAEPPPRDSDMYTALMERESGEEPEDLLARARRVTYRGLPTWKRVTLLSMGVIVNLAMAVLVFTAVLAFVGYEDASLTIAEPLAGGAAEEAGIEAGDRIVSVDGKEMADWMEFATTIATFEPDDKVEIGFVRDGEEMELPVVLGESEDGGQAFLGVQVATTHVDLSIWQALKEALGLTWMVIVTIASFFRPDTFSQAMENTAGVVGISVYAADAAKAGPLDYAWLVAMLSLSLGIMNILPIPPLDGGKVLLEIIERVIGRPLQRKISLGISLAGALLLFSFIGYVMYADVVRFIIKA